MKPVRTHTFSTGKWKIILDEHIQGYAEDGKRQPKEIYASSELSPLQALDTLIHEGTHAEIPQLSEARVERLASQIARLLWRVGYRRKKT